MNPSFWSWLSYQIFGTDNDYAKKHRYEKEMATFKERWAAWNAGLDSESEKVQAYKDALKAREEYMAEAEAYVANPLGKVAAIDNGLRAYRTDHLQSSIPEVKKEAVLTRELHSKEIQFMKEQHSKLPQGKILKNLEETTEKFGLADRTKRVIRNLLGSDPSPGQVQTWLRRGVFKRDEYKPSRYELPKLPDHNKRPIKERLDHNAKFEDLAEIAGFAALSHPDVAGKPLKEGLTVEETAKLNYSAVLNHLITEGQPNSSKYLPFLNSAREKAQQAIEAYGQGNVKLLADLLRNSIQQTNREVAALREPDTEHGMSTLYTISRMWSTLQKNPDLMDAVGLTLEEIQETKANVALHRTMTKGFEAKKALLEHALYRREMSPEEMKQAGCDILLAYRVADEVREEYGEINEINRNKEEYQEAEFYFGQPKEFEKAYRRVQLLDLSHPGFDIANKLLDEKWVNEAKNALLEKCNLDALTTMTREDLGKTVSSQIEFRKTFVMQRNEQVPKQEMVKENVPVKEENIQRSMMA